MPCYATASNNVNEVFGVNIAPYFVVEVPFQIYTASWSRPEKVNTKILLKISPYQYFRPSP